MWGKVTVALPWPTGALHSRNSRTADAPGRHWRVLALFISYCFVYETLWASMLMGSDWLRSSKFHIPQSGHLPLWGFAFIDLFITKVWFKLKSSKPQACHVGRSQAWNVLPYNSNLECSRMQPINDSNNRNVLTHKCLPLHSLENSFPVLPMLCSDAFRLII
jgi:hypothetical protein